MSGHTPGPWILKHISGSNFAVQRFEIRSGSGMPHPIFNKDTNAIDGTSACMSPQDANLIAAAPDLLEALEGARKIIAEAAKSYQDNRDLMYESIAILPAIDKAIARAKGEE